MVWLVFKARAGSEERNEVDDLDHGMIKPL